MAISLRTAQVLESINNVNPQAKVFTITFKLNKMNQVNVIIAPQSVAAQAEKLVPGFTKEILSKSRSEKPQAYHNFTQYLMGTGLRDYLASVADKLDVVLVAEDPSAAEDIFDHYSLGNEEDPIFNDMLVGRISIEIK
jgi:hypothetical protein